MTMPKMAMAAKMGGAVGIRANTVRDINAINRYLGGALPIIGLIKKDYSDSPVYITPTYKEARALIDSDCSVIALDATDRPRPQGIATEALVAFIREHSEKPIMADIATIEEAKRAEKLGFDYISTTMRSYTEQTAGIAIPDRNFMREAYELFGKDRIVAEGGIHTFEELEEILDIGYERVIIGGAITRPQNITRSYVELFRKK